MCVTTYISGEESGDQSYIILSLSTWLQVLDDWRYITMVIDRLLLVIFIIAVFCGTLTTFVNAPHIFEYIDEHSIKTKYGVDFT